MSDLKEQDINTAQSLDLRQLEVEKLYMPKDSGKYMLFYASVKKDARPEKCKFCGASSSLTFSGKSELRVIHDRMIDNYRRDIILYPPRLHCKSCDQRYVMPIEGIDDSHAMTVSLLKRLRSKCFLQSHTSLAEESGVSIESIRNILEEEIDKLNEFRKENPLTAPRVLGIDEKHIIHEMRGTIVDVQDGILLDMMKDNKPQTMKEAIMRLTDWDTRIEVVTTDMSNNYLAWLPEFLPNATVVIDKFHVIQDIQQRITTTKKQLYIYRKELINKNEDNKEKARHSEVLNIINENKRLFNYSMESVVRDTEMDLAQKLLTVIEEFPEFKLLRKLYYLIEFMYLQTTYEEAEAVWNEWAALLPPVKEKEYQEWCDLYSVVTPLFDEFRSFLRQGFQCFKQYILNYFKPGCRYTNAATEGINTLIKNVNSMGNGYSFEILRGKCLYISQMYRRAQYGIDLKTVKEELKQKI